MTEENSEVKYLRYERLQVVCDKALEESQKVLQDENLYSCYPTLSSTDEGRDTLQVVKNQLLESWSTNTKREFNAIFEERDIEKKLNELDQLIHDARIRQKQPNKKPTVHIDQLTPSNILASHLLPIKEQNLKKLETQLNELQSSNTELFNVLKQQLTEARELKSDVNERLQSLKQLNQQADGIELDTKLNKLIQITTNEEKI